MPATPRSSRPPSRSRLPVLGLLAALLPAATGAQELPLKTVVPGGEAAPCAAVPGWTEPTAEERAQARELGSMAAQSLILGDLERVRDLLDRAAELDPASVDLAYRHARVLEDLGETRAALGEYCRVLELDGADAETRADAGARVEALAPGGASAVPDAAARAFRMGVLEASSGRLDDALGRFRAAVAEAPAWSDARYNLGVVLARRGDRDAAADALGRYLEMEPGAPDALRVSRRIGELRGTGTARAVSPAAALGLGVIPGAGQLYTGRPGMGLGVLSLAGGITAASAWAEDGDDRTFVTPGLAVAGGVAMVGALDAFFAARRQQRGGQPPNLGPDAAFALGLLPGLGQLYRGRSGAGFTALALASGSAAGAFLYEEGEGRGYFGTGLGIAGAVTGLTALEAAFDARRRQRPPGAAPPDPGAALAAGLLPGLGHFYTGRLDTGLGFLALTSGLVAASDIAEDGDDRRYVTPGLGVAGAVTLLGATDAWLQARRVRNGTVGEPPNPAAALALGLVPGLGHFYSGRSTAGLVVLALASGATATSFLYEEGEGRGLFSEGLTAAGIVTGIGAIEAFIHARGRQGEVGAGGGTGAEAAVPGDPLLRGPALVGGGPGVRMRLLGVTF